MVKIKKPKFIVESLCESPLARNGPPKSMNIPKRNRPALLPPLVATPLATLVQFIFAGFPRFYAVRGRDSPSNPSLASCRFAALNRWTPGLAPPP